MRHHTAFFIDTHQRALGLLKFEANTNELYSFNMLRDDFKKITELDFDTVATVDHPYVSPPIRLIDSHLRLAELAKKQKLCLLNWDVSHPNDRTYRYDMQFDTAFVAKIKELFLFDKKMPYALQSSNTINLGIYDRLLTNALDYLKGEKKISEDTYKSVYERYCVLRDNVISESIKKDRLTSDYTERLLIHFYDLVGLYDAKSVIENCYLYYFSSSICRKWIPYCIKNAPREKTLENILTNSDTFTRQLFRPADIHLSNENINTNEYIKNNKEELTRHIQNGYIIPSIEVFYWSMELAGKYHYGNDYSFFERYSNYLNYDLENQLTDMYEDGDNILEIADDYAVPFTISNDTIIRNKSTGTSKKSRINSMFAVYLLLGEDLKNYIDNKRGEISIKEGEVVVTQSQA